MTTTSSTNPSRGNKVDGLPRVASVTTLGQNYLGFLVGYFWHNSSSINSFWLRLFVVRVLCHMQVLEHTRCSRKLVGKNAGGTSVEHVSENRDFE